MKRYSVVFAAALLFAACNNNSSRNYTNISGFVQGSVYSITYFDTLNRDFSTAFDSIFAEIDGSMSVFNDSSTISRINRNEVQTVNNQLIDVVSMAKQISIKTEGAFDITIGPVSRQIGFAGGKTKGIDTLQIQALLVNVGMDKIWVEGCNLQKQNPDVKIDLNAIAQGYTVDCISRFLEQNSVVDYIAEVGGEIVANGVSPRGTPWIVGVDKPIEGAMQGQEIQVRIYLSNRRGLATSGNYRKFVEVNGQRYSHTINPKTGLPVLNSLLSATVVAPNATIADALGTAFMVNGLEWSINFVNSNPDIDAYLIYSNSAGYNVWKSDGITEIH